MNCQKIDSGLMPHVMAPAIDANLIPGVTPEMILENERDYRQSRCFTGDNAVQPANVMDELNDIFA